MQTNKKRILFVNDAHFLYTGYGKYGRELLSRLSKTKKYELAELACYGRVGDDRDMYAEWHYYANEVQHGHPEYRIYNSHPQNQFGRWRFERVLLDFRPDIVCDIRDCYMCSFEASSPLRPFYHWVIMPPIDSAPQKEEWLDIYSGADSVLTYDDYGHKVLNGVSNKFNLIGNASVGVDTDIFRPVPNKRDLKKQMGFIEDCYIIGMVGRNQQRKLYPDLFIMFRQFIEKCYKEGLKELADKTYLYIHCSYPDMGWDIPSLIKENGLGRKILCTYICKTCGQASCSFFKDARTVCCNCNNVSAFLPSGKVGVSEEALSQVYNTFDLYIQYSTAEGEGVPQLEAAACGVPVMSVDYSAMSDIVRKTGGTPIKVQRFFRDVNMGSYRALPDNEDCINKIISFLQKPEPMKKILGNKARKAIENFYTWDNTVKIWETLFDNIELTGLQGKWDAPMRKFRQSAPFNENKHLTRSEYVRWSIANVMDEPERINEKFALQLAKELNYGLKLHGQEFIKVDRKTLHEQLKDYAENKLECELARTGKLDLAEVDYIKYAHMRAKFLE